MAKNSKESRYHKFNKSLPYIIKLVLLCFVAVMAICFSNNCFGVSLSGLTFLITLVMDGYLNHKKLDGFDDADAFKWFQLGVTILCGVALLVAFGFTIYFALNPEIVLGNNIYWLLPIIIILTILSCIADVFISFAEKD